MALLLGHGFCLLLLLSSCHIATVRTECSKDCAACTYRPGQRADINPLACTLECEGKLPSSNAWDTCKEFLQLIKLDIAQQNGERDPDRDDSHLLAKKYGGFMKRYGGFMKKMDELYRIEPDEENNGEILTKRYGGFMKKDSDGEAAELLRELLGPGNGDNPDAGHYGDNINESQGEVSKRYGGFMRGVKRSPEMEEGPKDLHKRYGGFMRRVGRPEWWLDYQKRYGGFMRRFTDSSAPSDEDGESHSKETPEMEKRYGGFMRY
ncbi:proenkephalin-A [Ambystoma mexicanum]|uniref:proenkephalin-A n=1 Tax=Ambystoma mexicanum TaxID=8296 RepID=UPI0037E88BD3